MPDIDRRTFLVGVGGAALTRWRAETAASPFVWTSLGTDAFVVQRGGGNTTVLVEAGGAVVIDLKLGGVGYALEREIRARVGAIQAVIITHHHADHSEGLSAFEAERSCVHRAAAPRIRADFANTAAAARKYRVRFLDETFRALVREFDFVRSAENERDLRRFADWAARASADARTPRYLLDNRTELQFGATTLEIVHEGPAHTDNDCYIVDRRRNLVVAGDLLFHRLHPFVDKRAGATTIGWQHTIERIRAAVPGRPMVVPRHGPVAGPDALDEQHRYFAIVREIVERERRAGRSRQEITAMANQDFPELGWADLWPENLGVLYDETSQ